MECNGKTYVTSSRCDFITSSYEQHNFKNSFLIYTTTCFGLFYGHHQVVNLQLNKMTC
jgi:hypothetical protein